MKSIERLSIIKVEKYRNVVSGVCFSCVTDYWAQIDEPAEKFWLEGPKIWDFRFMPVTQSSSFVVHFRLHFIVFGPIKPGMEFKSYVHRFFQNSFWNFSDFWWSVVTSPVDATIMVPRKLLNHWLTRCYNCGATIGYHSIGMTCWKNPIFHPYLLNNSERNWVTPIFYFRILISRIWRNLWPRVQSHLKVSI